MWNQPLVSDVWPPNTARRYVRALHPLLPQRRDPFPFPLPLAFSFLSAFPVRVATVAPRSSHRDTTGPVSDVRYVVVLVVTQLDVTRDGTGQEGELGGFVPGQCLDCWGCPRSNRPRAALSPCRGSDSNRPDGNMCRLAHVQKGSNDHVAE